MANESLLRPVRVRFPNGIFDPVSYKNDDGTESEAKYEVTVLIPKSDKKLIDRLKKEIEATIKQCGAWSEKQKKQVYLTAISPELGGVPNKYCILKDGDAYNERRLDEDKKPDPAFAGQYYIKFTHSPKWGAPFVVDQTGKNELLPAMAKGVILPGYWIGVQYSFYAWTNTKKGAFGCSSQFSGIQYVRKDEVFGREKLFDEVENTDAETEESEGGSFDE